MLGELIIACLLAGEGPDVTVLGPARQHGLLRVAVRQSGLPSGPVRVVAELQDATGPAGEASAEIADGSSLDAGIVLVLAPSRTADPALNLLVTLTSTVAGGTPTISTRRVPVATPDAALAAAMTATEDLRRSGVRDPLPWLWAEQAAELLAGGASSASTSEVEAITLRLRRWLDGWRPLDPSTGRSEWAIRDPVDDSVHPWRLHLPAGSGPFPVALMLATPARPPNKVRWPDYDGRLLAKALAAGLAVIEIHPAGDRQWHGAAWRRIPLVLEQAGRIPSIDTARGLTICSRPLAAAPYPSYQPPEDGADPDWWRRSAGPRQSMGPGTSSGLAAFASGPFTVVVGSGEHAAAAAANRRLADAFRIAWAAHAHGIAPELPDTVDPAALSGRNLVLIGNPRSNRVLSGLGLELPVRWDHRQVHGPGDFVALRAAGPSIALSSRLADGRQVLILDGSAPSWGDGLPLAGRNDPLLIAPEQ